MPELSDARRKELEKTLDQLQALADSYHEQAGPLKAHAFTELTGVMNAMVRIYRRTLEDGIDYTQAGPHSSVPLMALPSSVRALSDRLTSALEPFAEVRVSLKRD